MAYTHLLSYSFEKEGKIYNVSFLSFGLGTDLANQETIAFHGDFLH